MTKQQKIALTDLLFDLIKACNEIPGLPPDWAENRLESLKQIYPELY